MSYTDDRELTLIEEWDGEDLRYRLFRLNKESFGDCQEYDLVGIEPSSGIRRYEEILAPTWPKLDLTKAMECCPARAKRILTRFAKEN